MSLPFVSRPHLQRFRWDGGAGHRGWKEAFG